MRPNTARVVNYPNRLAIFEHHLTLVRCPLDPGSDWLVPRLFITLSVPIRSGLKGASKLNTINCFIIKAPFGFAYHQQGDPAYLQQILLSIPVYNSNHNKKHNWIKPNTIHNQSKLLEFALTIHQVLGYSHKLCILYKSY